MYISLDLNISRARGSYHSAFAARASRMIRSYRILIIALLLPGVLAAQTPAQTLGPSPEFTHRDPDRVKLGQLLFYDPILSGNQQVSCATCHHPRLGTSDGVSLSLGDGATGLGSDRVADVANAPEQRIPRNAPGLWNLGASEFTVFFHDGRLEIDLEHPNGIRTPLGADMTLGFQSALSAQAMFPVLSPDEMAGHYTENDISTAVRKGLIAQPGGAWDIIASRVAAIPDYAAAFDRIDRGKKIQFTTIANVIADFIAHEWHAMDSAFDRAMQGGEPLLPMAARGMELFYGSAGCSACHSGWLQTDHQFHAIAMPQIGPGKAARFESHARDTGRIRVTGRAKDAYAFRTPSLRNVTLTAPYGHAGTYATLDAVIRHHLDPVASLYAYRLDQAVLPDLSGAQDDRIQGLPADIAAIAAANVLEPQKLSDRDIEALISFLHALEDPAERLGVPDHVPSGLPVDQ